MSRHGTMRGYDSHYRLGERPCDACARARAAYDKERLTAPVKALKNRLHARALPHRPHQGAEMTDKATVFLFRQSGKYYTEEEWEIPADAKGLARAEMARRYPDEYRALYQQKKAELFAEAQEDLLERQRTKEIYK